MSINKWIFITIIPRLLLLLWIVFYIIIIIIIRIKYGFGP